MIYILYFTIFWILLPFSLYVIGFYLIDPLICGSFLSVNILNLLPSNLIKIAPFVLAIGIVLYTDAFIELLKVGKGLPVSARPPKHLVETGPYFWVRHPLYIGFHLMLVGPALYIGNHGFIIATGPLFLILWILYALIEEKKLINRIGNQYRRYRRETGLIIPSLYSTARLLLIPVLRLFFKLKMYNTHIVPKQGAFYIVTLHRSFLDPVFISAGIKRKIHFLTTYSMFRSSIKRIIFKRLKTIPITRYKQDITAIRKSIEILTSGGIVGLFPEGGRSWYGETVYSSSSTKLVSRYSFPIVSAEIVDNYSYYPRFSRFPKREKIKVVYNLYKNEQANLKEILNTLREHERKRDKQLQKLQIPADARGIEELIYLCPECNRLFSIKGFKNGRLICTSCGKSWILIKGKAIIPISNPNRVFSLENIEKTNINWLKSFIPQNIKIPCKYKIDSNNHRKSPKYTRAEILLLEREFVISPFRRIAYQWINSVLIEGNHQLEISYENTLPQKTSSTKKKKPKDPKKSTEQIYLIIRIPPSRALFLQHLLRLKAFGDPYTRYRGSNRIVLL